MMIRLSPEQVAKGWDILRAVLIKALPASLGIQSAAMSNILYSLLEERAQLWVWYNGQEAMEQGRPGSIILTAVVNEPISKVRYLLIYTMTALEPLTKEQYEAGMEVLHEFAQHNGCAHILTYVDNPARVRQLEGLGVKRVSTLMEI